MVRVAVISSALIVQFLLVNPGWATGSSADTTLAKPSLLYTSELADPRILPGMRVKVDLKSGRMARGTLAEFDTLDARLTLREWIGGRGQKVTYPFRDLRELRYRGFHDSWILVGVLT